MPSLTGSCLCGAVRFELTARFDAFHQCHCTQCRKSSGAAHAANLFTAPDNLRWLTGEDQVKRYDMPGRQISNAFCSQCGSAAPYLSLSGEAWVVPAGCLDGSPDMMPQDHIFWGERANWYEPGLAATKYERFPE